MARWEGRPAWMRRGLEAALHEGSSRLEVVGESFRQDVLWNIVGTEDHTQRISQSVIALLVPEADNPHDRHAVSVWVNGSKVGYLSRRDAKRYRPGILTLQRAEGSPVALRGSIVGGGMDEDGTRSLGVFLKHDRADFGVED